VIKVEVGEELVAMVENLEIKQDRARVESG
jgi:hypothetical protein